MNKLEKMTDDELLKKVLEYEGWHDLYKTNGQWYSHPKRMRKDGNSKLCPDYLNDRNAVAELVVQLSFAQLEQWGKLLAKTINSFYYYRLALVHPSIQLRAYWEVVK